MSLARLRRPDWPTIQDAGLFYGLRLAWVLIALLVVAIMIQAGRAAYIAYSLPTADLPLRQLGVATPLAAGLTILLDILAGTASLGLSLLLFVRLLNRRKKREPMALFTAYMLLTFSPVLNNTVSYLPAGGAWDTLTSLVGFLGAILFVLFMLIFPDGRYVPRGAVWLPRLFLAWFATWFFLPQLSPVSLSDTTIGLIVIAWMVSALGIQVYRYSRVSSPVERQQIKWVAYSLLALLSFETLTSLIGFRYPDWQPFAANPAGELVLQVLSNLIWLIFPAALVIAILRYRLWEIDKLINQTLVYTSLTLILLGVYFAGVIVLQGVFVSLSGQTSGLAAVLSTLAVAGLFAPLRSRLQAAINRRFYRSRYDAERILTEFSEAARSEVELNRLGQRLAQVVDQTLQPEYVSLWLVGSGPRSPQDQAAWRMLLEVDDETPPGGA